MLGSLITSKTRLRMLIKFFVSAANNGYLNGLANEFNESTNSIRKELNNLSSAGYLLKSKENNRIVYNANTSHPMFEVLQKIVMRGKVLPSNAQSHNLQSHTNNHVLVYL